MSAIDLLKQQHREVESLFKQFESAKGEDQKEQVFVTIADKLAIHATIEEKIFYPEVRARRTEDILLESLEEHVQIKRVLADLLDMECSDERFDPTLKALKETVEHHVEEEEGELFPKVSRLFDRDTLEMLAQNMKSLEEELEEKGDPRKAVPGETEEAPPLEH